MATTADSKHANLNGYYLIGLPNILVPTDSEEIACGGSCHENPEQANSGLTNSTSGG
jgi:hypothetical protein